jgi:hypothetical protein
LFHFLASAVPTPNPTPGTPEGFDPNVVTPGVWGFVITFGIVVAVVLLIVDMVRRTRRVNYRAAVNEQLDAEEAAVAEND